MQILKSVNIQEEEVKFVADPHFSLRPHVLDFLSHSYYPDAEWSLGEYYHWYFDTTDLQLYRAGNDLRLTQRLRNNKCSVSYKYLASCTDGYFSRQELQETLGITRSNTDEFMQTRSFQLAKAFLLEHISDAGMCDEVIQLQPVVQLHALRVGIDIWPTEERSASHSLERFYITFDRVTVEQILLDALAVPQEHTFFEMEVEIIGEHKTSPYKQRLRELSRHLLALGYTPSTCSKYAKALTLCGVSDRLS